MWGIDRSYGRRKFWRDEVVLKVSCVLLCEPVPLQNASGRGKSAMS